MRNFKTTADLKARLSKAGLLEGVERELAVARLRTALAGRISQVRRNDEVRQVTLAKSVGLTQSAWSRIESGESPVTVETWVVSMRALGLDPAEELRVALDTQPVIK